MLWHSELNQYLDTDTLDASFPGFSTSNPVPCYWPLEAAKGNPSDWAHEPT